MNTVGYTFVLMMTILIHVLLKKFLEIQKDQKDLIEQYRNKLNPSKLDYKAIERESHQKYIDTKDYNYKGMDYSEIENKGYDVDNDFDAMKEDLMKYIDGANDYFNVEHTAEPVADEKRNIQMNHNAPSQPLAKVENPFKGHAPGVSLDSQYKNQFESNNKNRNSNLPVQTLKPDLWNYANEKPMNGGFVDEKSQLMPYDAAEESNYVLL